MDEPSVLDYLKSRLMPWKYPRLSIPEDITPDLLPEIISPGEKVVFEQARLEPDLAFETTADQTGEAVQVETRIILPWRSLAAIVLALAAQASLASGPGRSWQMGVILLLMAIGLVMWASWTKE